MDDKPLWTPSAERVAGTQVMDFMRQVNARHGTSLKSYKELHAWSVERSDLFWDQIWDYCGVIGDKGASSGVRLLIDGDKMPGAKFFPDAQINFAENLAAQEGQRRRAGVSRGGQGVLPPVVGRTSRAGVACAAGAEGARRGQGRPGRGHAAQSAGIDRADAGGHLARRHLVELLAGFRRAWRAGPLRADRAQGVHRGRRLLV